MWSSKPGRLYLKAKLEQTLNYDLLKHLSKASSGLNRVFSGHFASSFWWRRNPGQNQSPEDKNVTCCTYQSIRPQRHTKLLHLVGEMCAEAQKCKRATYIQVLYINTTWTDLVNIFDSLWSRCKKRSEVLFFSSQGDVRQISVCIRTGLIASHQLLLASLMCTGTHTNTDAGKWMSANAH